LPLEEYRVASRTIFGLALPAGRVSDAIAHGEAQYLFAAFMIACVCFGTISSPLALASSFAGYARWDYRAPRRLCLGLGTEHFTVSSSPMRRQPASLFADSRQARLDFLNDTAHHGELLLSSKTEAGVRLPLIPVTDANPPGSGNRLCP